MNHATMQGHGSNEENSHRVSAASEVVWQEAIIKLHRASLLGQQLYRLNRSVV